ncbi:MAG: alpha/beta hydrolase [Cytophagales bacterium]|nr:MAG: alpha/beta hydrolase [Cytophagales bacterium]
MMKSTSSPKPAFELVSVPTRLGNIAVYRREGSPERVPILFLHGVYFDHHLWDGVVANITDRTVLTLDMPLHGDSRTRIPAQWTLADCADMLLTVLKHLQLPAVVAVGHSWGSMTILRAAVKEPTRFRAVGLCNMPLKQATVQQKLTFSLQHMALPFREFYMKQAAKSLFGQDSLLHNPGLTDALARPMSSLSNRNIRQIDRTVILNADDATALPARLSMPARALRGRTDYVPDPVGIETEWVDGGHVSPLEQPKAVTLFCRNLLMLAERSPQ